MQCPRCKRSNPDDAAFCEECGAKLERICPKCAAPIVPTAKFCKKCGAPLSAIDLAPKQQLGAETRAPTEAPDGERKTVTALFADIKGSMELMEDLDPEEARSIIDPALHLMMDSVHHYGGHVAQSTGDGIFALFGAPQAYEDHPQRALYAALRMQEALGRYSDELRREGKLPLQARVGVNTGEVVMRSVKTGEYHEEYVPVGHSTSLAARMQALAPIGSISATDATRKLCEGYFAFRSLGPTRIKGVSEPVEVFEVIGLGPLRTRLQRAVGRGLTKFVGREREMEALRHAAERARTGQGQIVAAMADAGVGKSRLFYEFKAVSQSGWMVLEAFSVSHGKASPYLPVLDLLNEYFRIASNDDARTRREKVAGRTLMLDRNLEESLPYLFALLGVAEGHETLAQMDPQVRRRRTHEALKRLLLRESLNQPLILIFEDLHWIDSETQALLNLLVESLGTSKVLLLFNYRPEYRHEWSSRTHYTQLRLDPLGGESAEEMLAGLLGFGVELAPLKRLIIERTQGNPFFMEETVQVLLDEGALVRNGEVKLTRPLGELKIPPTVQAILASRIDRLPAEQKDLLQTLAVIGDQFRLGLIQAVTGKARDVLERMLEDLQLGEFIYEQPVLPDIEYTFKHALTQEVAYNSVLAERRRIIHERTADAIEKLYPDRLEEYFAALARHYRLSNNTTKAVHYLQLASSQALDRGAYGEGASMIDTALKLLDKLPVRVDRLRSELALRDKEATIAFVVYGASSQERGRAIERMCELGEKLAQKDLLLRALTGLSLLNMTRGECSRALEISRRALELAESVSDPLALGDTHNMAGFSYHLCGHLGDAVSHYREALRQAALIPRDTYSTINLLPQSAYPAQMCQAVLLVGQADEAVKLANEALSFARQSRHPFTLGHALTCAGGWLSRDRREPETARKYAEEVIALSTEYGFAEWLPWGKFSLGWALTELGQVEEGVAEMEAGIADFRRMGGVPKQQLTIASLAYGYARLGKLDEALALLDEALAHVERSGELVDKAEMLRLKGDVLLMLKTPAEAEAESCFRTAIEVARSQEARWWELRATTSLARLLAEQDKRDEARTMLSEIYNWFTEGFDTADLKDAKALLEELTQ